MQVWKELGAAALMVPLAAFIHGLGLIAITKLFGVEDEALEHRALDPRSFHLVGILGLALFGIHSGSIAMFGLFYLWVGAARDLAEALFYSVSCYTTAGAGADRLPDEWKLLGGTEALVGLLLVGWSTAYLVRKLEKLRT
ncbi:MAG: hypothetical protein E6G94_14475 [Alphaproteobacteria bacterium]|nr:MAG: hypothetical protein E6G94_14475 [Alphaproteobacteria bacterium]